VGGLGAICFLKGVWHQGLRPLAAYCNVFFVDITQKTPMHFILIIIIVGANHITHSGDAAIHPERHSLAVFANQRILLTTFKPHANGDN